MSCVLLVDEDTRTLESWRLALCREGFDVLTAGYGRRGLARARARTPDVILAELRLPDISGLELLCRLREEGLAVPFFIVTAWSTIRSAVEAMRLGAVDYLEKPLLENDLIHAVRRGLVAGAQRRSEPGSAEAGSLEAHAAARWASAVVAVIDAPCDPKTLAGWGRAVHASAGTLKNWCRTAGLSGKRSLDFARLLRAVVHGESEGWRPQDSLNAADTRTLRRLLSLGRSTRNPLTLPEHVDDFLGAQGFIEDPRALFELRRALQARHG